MLTFKTFALWILKIIKFGTAKAKDTYSTVKYFSCTTQILHLQNALVYFSRRCCNGSLRIAPTRNCTRFLKIGLVVAEGEFYFYYIHQENKSDKERKIVRKKLSFMHK